MWVKISIGLGFLALQRGDYQEATRLAAVIRQRNASSSLANVHMAWYIAGQAALAQGQYAQAQEAIHEAITVLQSLGDRWWLAYCLNDLGTITCALGDYDEARQHAQESYTTREAFGDAIGMAVARALMGKIALLQGQTEAAQHCYEHSLALYQNIGDQGGVASALNGLGMVACAQGAYQDARSHLWHALQIAADMPVVLLKLATVTSSATFLLQTDHMQQGIELLTFVLHHPACDQETRQRASQTREQFHATVESAALAAAEQQGRSLDLDAAVQLAQQALNRVDNKATRVAEAEAAPSALDGPEQPALDALTERECEILRLIAEGCSNHEIAHRLVLSVSTIKWYTSQIYSKLGVRSRTQALAQAHARGLLV